MISKVKQQPRRKSDSALQAQKGKQAFSTPQPPKGGKPNKQKQVQSAQKNQTPKQNGAKNTPKQKQKPSTPGKKTPGQKRKIEDVEDDDDEEEEEDEEIQFKSPKTGIFKGQLSAGDDDDDDDEDEDDEDMEDDDDDDDDDDEEDDDEDDDEEASDDEDEEEEEEVAQPKAKKQKVEPSKPTQKEGNKKPAAKSAPEKSAPAQTAPPTVDEKRKMDLDSKTLYIKNLPLKTTVREIKALVPEVKQVRLRINTNRFQDKKKVFSGYAYLEFASEAVAEKSYKKLTGATILGNTIVVDYVGHKSSFIQARRKTDVEPENLDPMKLYLAGLPTDCSEADLRKIFPKAAEIKIPVRRKDNKALGYGFVTFSSAALAKEYHDKCQDVTLREMTLVVLYAHKRKEQPQKKEPEAKKKPEAKAQKVAQPPAKKAKKQVEEEEDDEDDDDDDDEDDDEEEDENEEAGGEQDDDEDDDDDDDDDEDDEEDDDDDDDDDDEDDD